MPQSTSRHAWEGRPVWAEVDLDAVARNIRLLKGQANGAALMAVVKANGYGHGAVAVARAAVAAGADRLGVNCVDEGEQLRRAGIAAPILVMGHTPATDATRLIDLSLSAAVASRETAEALARAATQRGVRLAVHLKVDTGLNRYGFAPAEVVALADWLRDLPSLEVEGLFTHFASADEADKYFTYHQIVRFQEIIESLERAGIRIPLKHAANSSAVMDVPESYLTMVRPGLILYGLHPGEGVSQSIPIKPVLSLKTRITFIKEIEPGETVSYNRRFTAKRRSRVATLPIGYADGLSRDLSNRGQMLVGGKRVPIIGTICMDQTVIDVTDIEPPRVGDEVVVYGQQGGERILVEEVARLLNSIPYVITCAVGRRVPRIPVARATQRSAASQSRKGKSGV